MSLPHKSVATIDAPEFVNLQPLDINPMMSKCEIKVFYLGENRNQSYISKDVALEMAKTLRGAPIVGYFKESKDDFADHGEKVTIDDEGIHFECQTVPYGFVAPDAEVWFKKFDETDDFGNPVQREYLMTTGYLWTGQYPEVQKVIDDGKSQSMELDNKTLQGHWAENSKNGMEFFIINDAVVSKLCILGDDVEPCFEGASVTKPEVSKTFSLDEKFTKTLFNMMKDLEFALKGEHTVDNEEKKTVDAAATQTEQTPATDFTAQQNDADAGNQTNTEDASNTSEFVAKKNEDEEKKPEAPATGSNDSKSDDNNTPAADDGANKDDDKEKKPATKNALHTDEEYAELESKYNELNTKYTALEAEKEALVNFKNDVEDKQKDELIAKFYMLSDEDKKDVIENKRNYSLDDIEAKLAVICYRKKVNFDLDASSKNEDNKTEEKTVTTFNLNDTNDSTPDWIKAVEDVQNRI